MNRWPPSAHPVAALDRAELGQRTERLRVPLQHVQLKTSQVKAMAMAPGQAEGVFV